jgi:putative PIN family toxin of toxin-antitoxin system
MATKLILDSNVWAIYAYGKCLERLLSISISYDVDILYSGQILKEVFTTCLKPSFQAKFIDSYEVVKIIERTGIKVQTHYNFTLSPDLKDNFLFDIYIQNHSDFLITQEKLLLNFKFRRIRIFDIKWLKENFPH